MRIIYYLILICSISIAQDKNIIENYESIKFLNSNIGWIGTSSGKVLKTTDGCNSWYSVTVDSNLKIISVYAVDENNLFVEGAENNIKSFFQSSNGGMNWEQVYFFTGANNTSRLNIKSIFFTSPDTGYALADKALFKTIDGGVKWIRIIKNSSPYVLEGLFFLNRNKGWIFSSKNIYKTSDGGKTWEESSFPFLGANLTEIFFSNDSTGSCKFEYNSIYTASPYRFGITKDGGKTWTHMFSRDRRFAFSVAEELSMHFILFRDFGAPVFRNYFYSPNGGSYFTSQNYPGSETLKGLSFFSHGTGYVCGDNQYLAKVIDYDLFTQINTLPKESFDNENITDYSLQQNYPNPFNAATKIKYQLHDEGPVTITIYDVLGKIIDIIKSYKQKGGHEFLFDGNNLPSGIYFYSIKANSFTDTKKMILMK